MDNQSAKAQKVTKAMKVSDIKEERKEEIKEKAQKVTKSTKGEERKEEIKEKAEKQTLKKENIIKYILYSSENNQNITEAVLEWQVINIIPGVSNLQTTSDKEIKEVETKVHTCICGLSGKYYYHLYNMLNKNTLYVGQECLKYFKNVKEYAVILLKQYQHSNTKKLGKKRMCHACLGFNIDNSAEKWKTVCYECFKEGVKVAPIIPLLGHRMCEDCFVAAVDPDLPAFRTKCLRCFKQHKASHPQEPMKACVDCGKMTVKQSETFRTRCYACYQLSK